MADKRVTELDAIDAVASSDLLLVVDDPSGTARTKKATADQVLEPAAKLVGGNYFQDDQVINGDLLVTGTITPLLRERAQQFQLRSAGERKMAVSGDGASGIVLSHDPETGFGEVATADYESGTFNDMVLEAKALHIETGNPTESVQVHLSGGITVGGWTDHDVDPGTGVVQAKGLGTTPLNASNLASGTMPDARLSPNVQMKPIQVADLPAHPPVSHHASHEPGGADALRMSAASRMLGRFTAGSGPVEELVLGEGLLLSPGGTVSAPGARNSALINYSYNNMLTEPPATGQVRMNAAYPFTGVTKLWLRFTSTDSQDVYWGVMVISPGSSILIQDKNDHTRYVRFTTTALPVDKGLYAEIAVVWKDNGTAINTAAAVLVQSTAITTQVHHTSHEPGGSDPLANVPWTNLQNVFTANQIMQLANPTLVTRDDAQPANARIIYLANSGQAFMFIATDDAYGSGVVLLSLNRSGDVNIGRDIREKGRSVAVGHWVTEDLNTYIPGFTGQYSYSFIGKTVLINAYGTATLFSDAASLPLLLPPGVTVSQQCLPTFSAALGTQGWIGGVLYFGTSGLHQGDLYLGDNKQWLTGSVQVALSFSLPIQ